MMKLGFRVSLVCAASLMLTQMPAFAYQLSTSAHMIVVQPGATPTVTTTDIQNAFNYLISRSDPTDQWVLQFAPGQYTLTRQITINGLKNTTIGSSSASSLAKFSKISTWNSAVSAEYLFYFRFCKQVKLIGCQFNGLTVVPQNANPNWGDQGVYFGSCNGVSLASNQFNNFGDAALRVVTDEGDPVAGVDSFNTDVGNNVFNNIYQTATTSTDAIHGGTATTNWHNNTFTNVQGSIKFATRTKGANNVTFSNNLINGGPHYGLEIDNYDTFTISGNVIENIKSYAITIYTNGSASTMAKGGFAWGSNYTITNNSLLSDGDGILYSHLPFYDGVQNVPTNLNISSNVFSNITEHTSYIPAILIQGGVVNGLKLTNNAMTSIYNKNYFNVIKGCTNVAISGNKVNNVAYTFAYAGSVTTTAAATPATTTTAAKTTTTTAAATPTTTTTAAKPATTTSTATTAVKPATTTASTKTTTAVATKTTKT